jgi:hypothetical protein
MYENTGQMHMPRPRKMRGMRLRHISRHPMKTGKSSSGGGTTKGGGKVVTKGGTTHGQSFKMPRPDKYGYY